MTTTHIRPYGPRRKPETGPDLTGLDELHRRLVKAACAGEWAEFGDDDVLDAEVLAALITGSSYQGHAPWPVARKGVRVTRGRVETRLDLSHAQIDWPVCLIDMDLPDGVDLTQARTGMIILNETRLKDVVLFGTIVQGAFASTSAIFNNPEDEVLNAQGAEIAAGLFLDKAILNGQCAITGAKIGGQFKAEATAFNTPGGIALDAQGAEIASNLFLRNTTLNGECNIAGAKIGGQVSATEAEFNTPYGKALNAQGAEIVAGLFLGKAILNGECSIIGAKVGGQISATEAEFNAPDSNALNAQGAEIARSIILTQATLTGFCDFNAAKAAEIFLWNATLKGQFTAGFGAQITHLDLSDATLISARHAQLDDTSSNDAPADPLVLDLTDARIGRLDMPQTPQHKICGFVRLTRCHVEHFCDHKRAWPDPLEPRDKDWTTPDSRLDPETGDDIGYFDLNGFTYDYLAEPGGGSMQGDEESTAAARRRWLLSQPREHVAEQFKPQPWRQMAARLDAQGHDDAARNIALHRRRIHRQSKSTLGPRIFVSYMLDILSHYGFNPWRTLGVSVGVIVVFALAYGGFAWTGPMPDGGYSPFAGYVATGPASDASAEPPPVFIRAQADDVTAATNVETLRDADPFLSRVYPDFNPLLYSLDVFVPVLDLGMETYWRPNPNYTPPAWEGWVWLTGSALYWLTIVQRFFGAILIAIMVTSFTGLLTREDRLG